MNPRPRLVVLGTGFGAFSLVKKVDAKSFDVTVISPRNHFLFTPLLPSTTVGTVEFRSIIEPLRAARPDVRFYQASATGVATADKTVLCRGSFGGEAFTVPYDILVIAVGATVNTFGIPGVEQHALFLKELADARAIRQRIIECFELAAHPGIDDRERQRLLHFVVVGGGPTGVEFAAEMHDFVSKDLKHAYASLMNDVTLTLLEAGNSILSTFDATLSQYTAKLFRRQRINVRTDTPVASVDAREITLRDGSRVRYGLVVWSTGIAPGEFVRALPFPKDRASRLLTDDNFRVSGFDDVYAVGDCATIEGNNLPATSQVAQQQGRYLAKAVQRRQQGKPVQPFVYRHYGMLAYVGGNRALADLAAVKGRGFSTWVFWRSAYLTKLVSWKNKTLVVFDWFKALVFGRDISRF